MSKEDMIKSIEEINKQLVKNKEVVNTYAGQEEFGDDVVTVCVLSEALISTKAMWKELLLCEYGYYYLG